MKPWFTIEQIDSKTHIISEHRHWEETHCYLLEGTDYALLIDSGLGIGDISNEVKKLCDKPIMVVATHIHWDHIGGHQDFPDFYVHEKELDWVTKQFPLSIEIVRKMVLDRCDPPQEFDINTYELFKGTPKRILSDSDIIDLGDRQVEVVHTPGHSPGHMCFWDVDNAYLFTGDLVYKDILFANYPSTDPQAYLRSLKKIGALPAKRIFPAHHDLDIHPEIIKRMILELTKLDQEGLLKHGSGVFNFTDWGIWL